MQKITHEIDLEYGIFGSLFRSGTVVDCSCTHVESSIGCWGIEEEDWDNMPFRPRSCLNVIMTFRKISYNYSINRIL